MADRFSDNEPGLESPAEHAFAITPHDTNELATYTRAIYVGTSGNLKLTTVGGDTVTFANVPDGVTLAVRAKIVFSTLTTASDLVGLY